MNSRPLTYLKEDQFLESLTPNYLIYGRSLQRCEFRKRITTESKTYRNYFAPNRFTNRFTKEYLSELLERHSNQKRKESNSINVKLKIEDVVLIHLSRDRLRNFT